MARITIRPRGDGPTGSLSLETRPAFSLLNQLLAAGAAIPHDCGGKAQCGTCRVRVLAGGGGLSRMSGPESRRLAAVGAPPGERLACQTFVAHDVELEIVGRKGQEAS